MLISKWIVMFYDILRLLKKAGMNHFFFGLILGGFWLLLRRSEGTVGYKLQDLVGKECTVSERIYADSVGKIVCDMNNMQVWHPARTVDGTEVARGERVRIQSVTGNILFVARMPKEGG